MKLPMFELKRYTQECTAVMAMDAAACYDRMLTYLSNIFKRWHGLPKTTCKAKSQTIFEMLPRIWMAYGESEEYYTSVGEDLITENAKERCRHHQVGKYTQ